MIYRRAKIIDFMMKNNLRNPTELVDFLMRRNDLLSEALVKIRSPYGPCDDETKSDFTMHDLIVQIHFYKETAREALRS